MQSICNCVRVFEQSSVQFWVSAHCTHFSSRCISGTGTDGVVISVARICSTGGFPHMAVYYSFLSTHMSWFRLLQEVLQACQALQSNVDTLVSAEAAVRQQVCFPQAEHILRTITM